MKRANPYRTSALIASKAATQPMMNVQWLATTFRLTDMPIARKNRPSNSPLNGSMAFSRSCR
ncbi:hypothetical protein D3C72_1974090 [compost metagenome]